MTHLVGQDRFELFDAQRLHEGKTHDQIIPMPSEEAESRHLRDAGAKGWGDQNDMDRCRLQSYPQRVEQAKQLRSVGIREHFATRWFQSDPESAHHGNQEHTHDRRELASQYADRGNAGNGCGGQSQENEDDDHEIGVSQSRQQKHASTVRYGFLASQLLHP
jgi:hypothetical protein